jgi:hypothetical protein
VCAPGGGVQTGPLVWFSQASASWFRFPATLVYFWHHSSNDYSPGLEKLVPFKLVPAYDGESYAISALLQTDSKFP